MTTPSSFTPNIINVRFAKKHPDALIPQYKTKGAACFDLHVLVPEGELTIEPDGIAEFGTGLVMEVPEGWRLDVFGRSGLWFKSRLRLGNCVGKIDSDFRGELQISVHNHSKKPLKVKHGDRLCQGEFNPVTQAVFDEVPLDDLSETERGDKGLGSSGVSA